MTLSRNATLICGAILAGLLVSCTGEKPEAPPVIRSVRYESVHASFGQRNRAFSGVAKAGLESNLSFRVSGIITRITVNVGDDVKKGDLIARLDASGYQLQVQETEAGLEQARAQALNAKSNYQRVRGLYENNNASKSELDAARAQYDSGTATVRSIRKRLELARLQVGYTHLKAPFSGAVSSVPAQENENVGAGRNVVVLTSQSRPEVSVAIPEVLIAQVQKGARVTIKFDALPGETFRGGVTEVGVATTKFATTYQVTSRLEKTDMRIKPGMAATVTFNLEASGDARIFVPSHAVGEDQNGRFAYIALPGKEGLATVKRTSVQTGELVSEGLEILDGLSEGDFLITAGVSRLRDGMLVKVKGENGK